ncbi:MAG: NapC/NirT family cytochrome c [Verrucomicrobiales bacterium]|nr:NapC/NirT family cytochrome c [Verrucomicrobiales bacterium]
MSQETERHGGGKARLWQNWVSLSGLMVVIAAFFAFVLLWLLELFAGSSNPYVGILAFLVAPGFMILGIALFVAGILVERRRLHRSREPRALVIDLASPKHRRTLLIFSSCSIGFLFLTALGSYQTFHLTESTTFCGEVCHTVMEPERVAYQDGAHARVSCVECHIGSGAEWFVRAKLSGSYQVYATLFNKYPRPVPTPIKNLRPAQDTCEQCHWPESFVGDVVRTVRSFQGDEEGSEYSVKLELKVGGADPTRGPTSGIHWHMNVANKVEYFAEDESRQTIPWVRVTDREGQVTVYRADGYEDEVDESKVRRMDCMDCHNRPAHNFHSPNKAVNLAISLGRLDRALPYIKTNAVYALVQEYSTKDEAMSEIGDFIQSKYRDQDPNVVAKAVEEVRAIYGRNFFPAMKASWLSYPNNIGHKEWPGCFRCHDDNHKTEDGEKVLELSRCDACHIILAQGSGDELDQLDAKGQPFRHPGEEYDTGWLCSDCHNGGL